jgi:hypothetical protein
MSNLNRKPKGNENKRFGDFTTYVVETNFTIKTPG